MFFYKTSLKVKYEKYITHFRHSSLQLLVSVASFLYRGKGANIWAKLYYSSSAASDMKYVQSCAMLLLDGSPCRLLLEKNGEPRLAYGASSLLVTLCLIRADEGRTFTMSALQRSSCKGMTFGLCMTQ